MYLSKLSLDPGLMKPTEASALLGDEYRLHQSIWSAFSDRADRTRDFLYRVEPGRHTVCYALSAREPSQDGPWTTQTKQFDPKINDGDMLRFSLRANPVVSRKDANGRPKRHDVVMDLKRQRREGGMSDATVLQQDLVHEAGYSWLARKGEDGGFSVQPHQIAGDAYTQHELRKKGTAVRLSSIDFKGILEVTDAARFKETLTHGIGPAKGFGMGLMLVRRM